MATWSNGISLRGLTGPQSIVTVTAPPGPTVGVVDGYAVWNNNGIVLLYGPKTASGWPQVGGAAGSGNPASVQLTGQKGDVGAAGIDGNTIIPVTGQPENTLGKNGDYGLDFSNAFLYGPKAAGVWPTQPISIVGPRGQDAALGVDLSGNSLSLSPLANASVASGIKQVSSGGATLFASDNAGNVQAAGTLKVTGATTLAAATVTGLSNTGSESVAGTLTVTGSATLAGVSATNVSASGTLSASGATTLAALSATTVAASSNATVGGTLGVTGATTTAALTSSTTVTAKNLVITSGGGGQLTFADGTTMATAATGSGSGSATSSRSQMYRAGFYSTNATANALYTLEDTQSNDAALTQSPAVIHTFERIPFAFTLTGWSVNQYVTNGANTFQVTRNRTTGSLNSIVTQAVGTPSVSGFPGNQFSGTWTKGTYNFAAGDLINVVYQHSTGTTTNVKLTLWGEWT